MTRPPRVAVWCPCDGIRYARRVRIPRRPVVVAVLAFAYLMTYPLIIGRSDESHLLHGARRLLDGQVLYRDFFEIITPLSFYFIAGAYWIGGTTLRSARIAIALVNALGGTALFALVRQVAGTWEAVVATLILLVLCIPVWPYASPHWMSTTLGLLVAAVLLADRWQDSSRVRPLVAGLLSGAAVCVQQQRGVFLLVWLVLALPVLAVGFPRGMRWRALGGQLAWALGAAAAVVLVVLGYAAWAASPAVVVESLYGFAAESYGPQHVGSIGWAGVFPLTEIYLPATWRWLLRIAPLFLLAEGLALAWDARGPWHRSFLVRVSCWLLAALMALSVWYLPDFIHVAFVTPFLLLPGARLLHAVRGSGAWSRVTGGRAVRATAMTAVVLVLGAKGVGNVVQAWAAAQVRVETAFGPLYGDPYFARLFETIRRHLVPEAEGRSLLYAYPGDAWLYLALPADDATRFEIFFTSFPKRYVDEVLAALRSRRAGTVVLMTLAKAPEIDAAVAEGYDLVEELYPYRIYVRRAPPAGDRSAHAARRPRVSRDTIGRPRSACRHTRAPRV
jgi:hypothetical protein